MSARVAEVDGRRILFTDPEALLWPEDGVAKEELLGYYLDVADHLMPFLVNRPFSLLRGLEGGEYVYQRTAPPGLPSWITTRRIRSEQTAHGYAEYVVGTDRAALVYLLNLGYAFVTLKAGNDVNTRAQGIETLGVKLGSLLLVLGALHTVARAAQPSPPPSGGE